MKRTLALARHEIQIFLQDKFDLFFGILLPIIVFTLMYFGFGGDTVFNATASIVNNDEGGVYTTEILNKLEQNDSIEIDYYTDEEAEVRLERSDLVMVLYIPEGFSEKLEAGESAKLVFKQLGNGGQEGQIIASIISGIADEINLEMQAQNTVSNLLQGTGVEATQIESVVRKYLDQEKETPVVRIKETTLGSSPDLVSQFLPGVINMFVLFSLTMSARVIAEERKRGTLERLLTTRLSVGEMFSGKFIANVLRGFIQTLILLVLAYVVFGLFTPVSFLESLVVALIFAASASGMGMVIATLARSEEAATWMSVFFTMGMVMLGGSFFEITEGTVLYTLSRFSIITYANDAFRMIISEGGSITDLGMELGILASVFVGGLILSRILFKIVPGGR